MKNKKMTNVCSFYCIKAILKIINIIFGILIYNYHSLRITLITYINKRVGLSLHKK